MEKLIELLNEYEKDKIKDSEGLDVMYIWKYEGILHYYNNYKDENIFDNVRFLIISKSYGFIKWLVENNKIDNNKVIELEHNGIRPFKLDNLYGEIKLEERLIMLLSIQNNPIKWLCEILK